MLVYVFALALIRASGKRSVKHGDVASFVLAVVVGDLFDDALWAEVPMAEFVVGAGTLTLTHVWPAPTRRRGGRRRWRQDPAPDGARP